MRDNELTGLEALMIAILRDEGRLHGLDIARAAKARGHKVLPGTLYRTLHRLAEKGMTTSAWEQAGDPAHRGPGRRYYQLTATGESALQSYRIALQKQLTALESQGAAT